MTGLPVTGRLDSTTRTKMVSPRCGMPYMVPQGSLPDGAQMAPSKNNQRLRPQNFYVPGEVKFRKEIAEHLKTKEFHVVLSWHNSSTTAQDFIAVLWTTTFSPLTKNCIKFILYRVFFMCRLQMEKE